MAPLKSIKCVCALHRRESLHAQPQPWKTPILIFFSHYIMYYLCREHYSCCHGVIRNSDTTHMNVQSKKSLWEYIILTFYDILFSQKEKLTEEIVENDRGLDMNENCNKDKEINHNKTEESPTIILTEEYWFHLCSDFS